jgi:Leucine-rich repeat (LRR) protein
MNNAKSITQWSTESDSLKAMMLHERKNGKTRNAASIYGFVLNLFLDNKGIHDCDATLLNFNRLTELHISNNKLSELRNLPPTLQILHAYGNRLRSVDFNATRALVHVGLGYNAFSGVHLPMFKPLRASLVSLDLSANEFCDLDELLKALVKFPQLRHLYLMVHPVVNSHLSPYFTDALSSHYAGKSHMYASQLPSCRGVGAAGVVASGRHRNRRRRATGLQLIAC